MFNEEKFKELKKHTTVCIFVGLAMVTIHYCDPPGSSMAAFCIRLIGSVNIVAAIVGLLVIMRLYQIKEKKRDPV